MIYSQPLLTCPAPGLPDRKPDLTFSLFLSDAVKQPAVPTPDTIKPVCSMTWVNLADTLPCSSNILN